MGTLVIVKFFSGTAVVLFVGAAWLFLFFQVAGPLLPKTDICKRKALTSIPAQNHAEDQPVTNWPFDSIPSTFCQISPDIPVEQRLFNTLWHLFEFKSPKIDTSKYSFSVKEFLKTPPTPPPDPVS